MTAKVAELLTAFQSADNAMRKQAERTLESLPSTSYKEGLQGFVSAITSADQIQAETAAVLLRKLYFDNADNLKRMDRPAAELVERAAMSLLGQQKLSLMKRGCELLAKVCVYLLKQKQLLVVLNQGVTGSPTLNQKLALMYLAQICCQYALDEKALLEQASVLEGLFAKFMNDNDLQVRAATIVALTSFLASIQNQVALMKFEGVLPVLLGRSIECLKDNQDAGKKALSSLTDLVESRPKFVKGAVQELIALFTEIMVSRLNDSLRIQAMAGMLALAESHPASLRKSQTFKARTSKTYLAMLMEIQGIQLKQWMQQLKQSAGSSTSIALAAKQNLAHISTELGVKFMLSVFSPMIGELIRGKEAKGVHAAMCALAMMSEGLGEVVSIDDVVPVLLSVECNNVILQEDLITCLALLSEEFSPKMHERFGGQVAEVLVQGLNSPCQRIVLRATQLITNYVGGLVDSAQPVTEARGGVRDRLKQIVDLVVQSLSKAFSLKVTEIQEESLSALSILADLGQAAFVGHYQVLMKELPSLVPQEAVPQQIKERCIICMGHLLTSLKDLPQFESDCPRVLNEVISLQQSLKQDDDSLHTAILQFYQTICAIYKDKFCPFLPRIIPRVLNSIRLNVQVQLVDPSKKDESSMPRKKKYTSATVDLKLFGGVTNIVMNTSALELKIKASQALLALIQHTGPGFKPFAEAALPTIIDFLSFKNSKEIRHNMAQTLAPISKLLSAEERLPFLNIVLPPLMVELQNLLKLKDDKGICILLEQLCECVEKPSPQMLTMMQAAVCVVPGLVRQIRQSYEGRDKDEGEEEKEEEQVEEAQQIYEWVLKAADKWSSPQLLKGIPETWVKQYREGESIQ